MRTTLLGWTAKEGWRTPGNADPGHAHLVLYFGNIARLEGATTPLSELAARFPNAVVAGCSTAGEIFGCSVRDDSIAALCVTFEHSRVRAEMIHIGSAAESFDTAAALGRRLDAPDLQHVFVLSDGLNVNGTPMTRGFRSTLTAGVSVTGGLAGDDARFQRTVVGLGADVGTNRIVAIGFYGDHLHVGYGSAGGWEAFGPRRLVTKSAGNVLYELDDQPALALYKRYLGDRASELPASGLLFPLYLLPDRDAKEGLVRSILAIDDAQQSLTFAGDIPKGHYVRLMKAGHNALVDGAGAAAGNAIGAAIAGKTGFVVMVSCVGRKLVMGQRIEEEVEAVLAQLGADTPAVGFYSYGEICPSGITHSCDLHNQTMTLTSFSEEA